MSASISVMFVLFKGLVGAAFIWAIAVGINKYGEHLFGKEEWDRVSK